MKIVCVHTLPGRQTHKEPSKGSKYFTATSLTSESTSENLFQINILLCLHGKMKIQRVLGIHIFFWFLSSYASTAWFPEISGPFKCTYNHRLSDLANSLTSSKIRGQSFRSWSVWWGCGTAKATHAAQLGLTQPNIQSSPCSLCSHSCLESLLAMNTETGRQKYGWNWKRLYYINRWNSLHYQFPNADLGENASQWMVKSFNILGQIPKPSSQLVINRHLGPPHERGLLLKQWHKFFLSFS